MAFICVLIIKTRLWEYGSTIFTFTIRLGSPLLILKYFFQTSKQGFFGVSSICSLKLYPDGIARQATRHRVFIIMVIYSMTIIEFAGNIFLPTCNATLLRNLRCKLKSVVARITKHLKHCHATKFCCGKLKKFVEKSRRQFNWILLRDNVWGGWKNVQRRLQGSI